MKRYMLLLVLLIYNVAIAQKPCDAGKPHIITEHIQHPKHIFFFKTNRQKHINIEKAVDANGKVLAKAVMKTTCSYDACGGGAFSRVVFLNGEIHKAYAGRRGRCRITRYDLCGNKIAKEKIDARLLEEKYGFNAIRSSPENEKPEEKR